jgi:SAM-dependent methyltransferase
MGHRAAFDAYYHRQREAPDPADPLYLHLVDLLDVVRPWLAAAEGRWLDLGSGTSPYRRYLPCEVVRADVDDPESADVAPDIVLVPGEPCPAPTASFDGVLSTQVLEHVPDPAAYLADAYRLLKPGGTLVVTTHGIYEDHPCPLDLWRWTADGLRHLAAQAGFEVRTCTPVTCGPRAVLFLATRALRRPLPRLPPTSSPGVVATAAVMRAWHLLVGRALRSVNQYGDQALACYRTEARSPRLYIAVAALAVRPPSV